MFTCVPRSTFSWNFQIIGTRGGDANLTFDWWSEKGTIRLASDQYQIRKPSFLIGRWLLWQGGQSGSEAVKSSPFLRQFTMNTKDGVFTLKARSPIGRSFDVYSDTAHIGDIRPEHAFTRRSIVDCSNELSQLDQLFAFWLVALTWRRNQSSG
jgi:hypothetical protein